MSVEEQLRSLEERVAKLEGVLNSRDEHVLVNVQKKLKQVTLTALARDKKIKNGQQKVAVIVGYYEKLDQNTAITETDIKTGWKDGKFSGGYANVLLQRAIKDVLIRDLKNGSYDLTQQGEDYFETIVNPSNDNG